MIRLDSISQRHGKQILFVEASCAINRGEKVGLVGPNGAGKTTLFRLIMKEEDADNGQVAIDRGTTIGYFSQDVGDMREASVVGATIDGAGPVSEVAARLAELESAMADPEKLDQLDKLIEEFGEVQSRFEELGGYALDAKAREILAGLGFAPDLMDRDVSELSGGWKMRVALARILLMRPDALLLDEPTNHLDLESILWLEGFLKNYDGALMMTCHDKDFLNRIVTKIIDVDGGDFVSYSGNYEFYEAQRAMRETQAAAQYERQQAMFAKEQRFIDRFKATASHATQVQSRVKKLEKIEVIQPPVKRKKLRFNFPAAPRSGDDVAKIEGLNKAYGDHVVFQDFSLLVRRKERWCVMGVNGAGKSTLLKLVAGATQPDSGVATLGASVKLGYFAQHAMDLLKPQSTVWDSLNDAFPKASIGSLRSLAGAFGFSDEAVEKQCKYLSGGEKARLVLALMLYEPPNFLVLDEPTNHLDLDTKAMLVEVLKTYEGTLLIVSHDRYFLRALSNRVLELLPGGPKTYGGGYSEYVAQAGYEAPGVHA